MIASHRRPFIHALCALLSVHCTAAVASEPVPPPANVCRLAQLASVNLSTQPDGRVSVPVSLNGHSMSLIVDTGGIYNALGDSAAATLGLKRKAIPAGVRFEFYGKDRETELATVEDVEFSGSSASKWDFLLMPDRMLSGDVHGLLGPNLMALFDTEIDFAKEKFNLFAPDHCPGQVVYWTQSPYAKVPMRLDASWHITIPVMLDGKSITATVDTGASDSVMTVEHARSLFGWPENDPRLKSLGSLGFHYPFATMTFEGIQVLNPEIRLVPKALVSRMAPELLLGDSILRQLRLYIAYKEHVLYLTSADAQ